MGKYWSRSVSRIGFVVHFKCCISLHLSHLTETELSKTELVLRALKWSFYPTQQPPLQARERWGVFFQETVWAKETQKQFKQLPSVLALQCVTVGGSSLPWIPFHLLDRSMSKETTKVSLNACCSLVDEAVHPDGWRIKPQPQIGGMSSFQDHLKTPDRRAMFLKDFILELEARTIQCVSWDVSTQHDIIKFKGEMW